MSRVVSRRDVLKQLGTAGAGVVLAQHVIRGQSSDLVIAGKPVEIVVSSLSATTVRLTILPIDAATPPAMPVDGALMHAEPGKRVAQVRGARTLEPVSAGDLVVRVTANPPTIQVNTRGGQPIQTITLDARAPDVLFLLSKGPLLGMGQGTECSTGATTPKARQCAGRPCAEHREVA